MISEKELKAEIQEAYRRGLADGKKLNEFTYDDGFDDGYMAGFNAGYEEGMFDALYK